MRRVFSEYREVIRQQAIALGDLVGWIDPAGALHKGVVVTSDVFQILVWSGDRNAASVYFFKLRENGCYEMDAAVGETPPSLMWLPLPQVSMAPEPQGLIWAPIENAKGEYGALLLLKFKEQNDEGTHRHLVGYVSPAGRITSLQGRSQYAEFYNFDEFVSFVRIDDIP